jgi:phosphoglycolate phosphatase-like HAD superfamily hydrolase
VKLLLFDLDGTIVRTQHTPGRVPFYNEIHATFGVEPLPNGVYPDGKTDPVIIGEILAHAGSALRPDVTALLGFTQRYAARLATALASGTTRVMPVPGVRAVLDMLAGDPRFGLAMVTGNLEPAAHLKVRAAGLDRFFTVGAFGSDSATRAALPEIARARFSAATGRDVRLADCVIIGDTPLDHAAAAANGLACVLVASGRTPITELAPLGAAAVFPDWSDAAAMHAALARL